MKRIFFLFIIVFLVNNIYAQENINRINQVPITKVFYKIDKNIIGSFTYHYGLNYALAGAATVTLIESDVDWNWYRYTYKNGWMFHTGYSAFYVGQFVPFIFPLGLYLYGRSENSRNLQITGLAIGQAAITGFSMSILLKVFTGRVPPINLSHTDDLRGDFRFGFLKGGVNNGWPSSHTCTAFAMSSSLIALYPDNTAIKIGSLAYATYIGLGVSTSVHWFSDFVAGALIGYAIGTSVGRSFKNLMDDKQKEQAFNFYVTPLGASLNYRF